MDSSDKRLERIEIKLDDISDHLSSIDITLAKQSIILDEHIKRTALLEKEVKPIKNHVIVVNGIAKLIALLSTLAALYKFFR